MTMSDSRHRISGDRARVWRLLVHSFSFGLSLTILLTSVPPDPATHLLRMLARLGARLRVRSPTSIQ